MLQCCTGPICEQEQDTLHQGHLCAGADHSAPGLLATCHLPTYCHSPSFHLSSQFVSAPVFLPVAPDSGGLNLNKHQ